MKKDNLTYEEAMKKLQQLTEELEKGELTLEETVKLYDEATKLSGYCTGLLNNAKLRISEMAEKKEEE